jgi:phosphate/sulfate permease
MIIILWIIFAVIVGAIGSNRNIGFFGAFILSIILSPVIGLIITLLSPSKEDIKYKQEVLNTQKKQEKTLQDLKSSKKSSIAEEINELKKLFDSGVLTEDEFKLAKQNLIGENQTVNK